MDSPISVAVIAAAAAIVVPAISFYFTKSKEREADWQRTRLGNAVLLREMARLTLPPHSGSRILKEWKFISPPSSKRS